MLHLKTTKVDIREDEQLAGDLCCSVADFKFLCRYGSWRFKSFVSTKYDF